MNTVSVCLLIVRHSTNNSVHRILYRLKNFPQRYPRATKSSSMRARLEHPKNRTPPECVLCKCRYLPVTKDVGIEPTAPKGCPGDVLTNDVLLLESNQRLQHYECCALPTELSSGLDMGIEPMHADYSSAALPSELIKVPDILLRQNPYHGTHDTQRAVRRWSGGISYSTVVPLSSGSYAY